jgi:ribosomal protein L37AE/L43A
LTVAVHARSNTVPKISPKPQARQTCPVCKKMVVPVATDDGLLVCPNCTHDGAVPTPTLPPPALQAPAAQPPAKPDGSAGFLVPLHDGTAVIRINREGKIKRYLLRVVGACTFRLTSFTEDGGDTHITRLQGDHSTCTCKGFQTQKKPCRHILGLIALYEAGKL